LVDPKKKPPDISLLSEREGGPGKSVSIRDWDEPENCWKKQKGAEKREL